MLTRPTVAAPTSSPTASINQNLAAVVDGEALLAEQARLDDEEVLPIAAEEPTDAEVAHPLFGSSLRDPQVIIETAQAQAAQARKERTTDDARSLGFRSSEEVAAEARRAARRTRWTITAMSSTGATVGLFAAAIWLGGGGGV